MSAPARTLALIALVSALALGASGVRVERAGANRCGSASTPYGAAVGLAIRAGRCKTARRVLRRWSRAAHERGVHRRHLGRYRCRTRARKGERLPVVCRRGRRRVRFRRLLAPKDLPAVEAYSAESPFNRRIGPNPEIDPDSELMVSGIEAANARQEASVAWRMWSVPVYFADAETPRRRVRLTARWSPARRMVGVPLPDHAAPDPRRDAEMAVIDTSAGCEYDFWQADRRGRRWKASWANAIPLSGDGVFPRGLSARGSGFGLLGGLIQPHELRAGYIDHALVWSYFWPRRGGPVAPATESDGVSRRRDAIPEGARVQLNPHLDLNALDLTPYERTVARALQEYGAYLADIGSAFAVYAMHPISRRTNPYRGLLPPRNYPSLDGIPFDQLRVLELPPQYNRPTEIVPNGCNHFRR